MHSIIKHQQGVTLPEVMIVIAIIGIIAATAVPSYQNMIERNRLKQAVESLKSDMQFARTEAIKRSADTALTLTAGWSYTVTSGGTTLKTVQGSEFQGIALGAAGSVTFSFRRGTPNTTLQSVLSSTSYKAAIDACQSGRVIVCVPAAPTDRTGLPGYTNCPGTAGQC